MVDVPMDGMSALQGDSTVKQKEHMMKDNGGFRKLKIYERSYKASLAIYQMIKSFPKKENDELIDQMRRASMSIPLNIAEGYAKRESQREFKRFLKMAIGSANEMSVLIDYARDFDFINNEKHEKASKEYDEIGKMLNVFIQTINEEIQKKMFVDKEEKV